MSSVADALRKETFEAVQRLSPDERVSLALELGDFDLALFCASKGIEPVAGIQRLRENRQAGRRISAPETVR